MHRWRLALWVLMALLLAGSTRSQAGCNVIPGVRSSFRGALGSVDRPFAIPNDEGSQITIALDLDGCDTTSPGFPDLSGGAVLEDDYLVTVLFEPPGGARNAVVLATGVNHASCESRLPPPGSLPGGGSATCLQVASPGLCAGGEAPPNTSCIRDSDCGPTGSCIAPLGDLDFIIRSSCVGGTEDGLPCFADSDCPSGTCRRSTLTFRFPDTDDLLGSSNDDLTLTGPTSLAISPASAPLPLGLASARCADTPGLVACIDELLERDGTCETTADHVGTLFGHFTALPPANDFQSLCTTGAQLSPCEPQPDRQLRFTIDAAGNVLIPMEFRGVLIEEQQIPIPRLVLGESSIEAFPGGGVPVQIPSDAFVDSFSPGGQRLPPIFTPITDPAAPDALALFGSVDTPVSVLRIQRQGCVGGTADGAACASAGQCPSGGLCQSFFDFSSRLEAGVGPVLLLAEDFLLETENPVPLDGLIESESLFAFVVSEALEEQSLNDDSDATDAVVSIRDRSSGETLPTGTNGAIGRAVTRLRTGRFRFPALAVEDDLLAFLELEPSEGGRDANGNGSVFDSILRVYRLQESCGGTLSCAEELSASLPGPLAVDAAPLVEGRSLFASEGLVYFRTPEWRNAQQVTERISIASDGAGGNADSGFCQLAFTCSSKLSDDGRFVAFESHASNLVATGDGNGEVDVFLRDRQLQETHLISVASGGSTGDAGSQNPLVSADGGSVAFWSSASNLGPAGGGPAVFLRDRLTETTERIPGSEASFLVAGQAISGDGAVLAFQTPSTAPGPLPQRIVVHDRSTGETEVAGLGPDESEITSQDPALSTDGALVAFSGLDEGPEAHVFVRDRRSQATQRIDVAADGSPGNGYALTPAISADSRFVAFGSTASNLVANDTNDGFDIFVRDQSTGRVERVSVASDGGQASQATGTTAASRPTLSADGRLVAFESNADNLVPGDVNGVRDIFLHDRLTGATQRVSVASCPGPGGAPGVATALSRVPALSADGRTVAFQSPADNLVCGDTNGSSDVFVRGPSLVDASADRSGDGDVDDTLLEVLDATGATPQWRTLLPADQVVVAAGSAAFLVPERATRTDRNGDGDVDDGFVHLSLGGSEAIDLAKEAIELAMSAELVAARVPSGDPGESFVEVCDWPQRDACWLSIGSRASAIAVVGDTVALLAPECPEEAAIATGCTTQGTDLNGDGDFDDRVVRVYRGQEARLIEVGYAAEEIVLGERIVAFRTPEQSQNQDLNSDGDLDDGVLLVFDLVSEQVFNSEQAVLPCPLEACDPRLPYRVDGDIVTFITAEADQGDRDLDGDGDANDLVKQSFNVREAAQVAPGGGQAAGCVQGIASASAGICPATGQACAVDADCGSGRCYLPPGACLEALDTDCSCGEAGCQGCGEDEFCVPTPGSGGVGKCQKDHGSCASQVDCPASTICTDAAADVHRLFGPLAQIGMGSGESLFSSGTCVEELEISCSEDEDCPPRTACSPAGSCRRSFGACRNSGDCANGLHCAPKLVIIGAADTDLDRLADPFDNCPTVANVDQSDLDRDSIGDACDRMTCGNGALEFSEACDDGGTETEDGCSATCVVEAGYVCAGEPSVCMRTVPTPTPTMQPTTTPTPAPSPKKKVKKVKKTKKGKGKLKKAKKTKKQKK